MNPMHPQSPPRPQAPVQQAPYVPPQAPAPAPSQTVTAHLNDLVSRELYPLLHAAEFVLATLDTAIVITRAKFPELHPMAPHYPSVVLEVQTRLTQLLSPGEDADGDDDQDAHTNAAGAAPTDARRGR